MEEKGSVLLFWFKKADTSWDSVCE